MSYELKNYDAWLTTDPREKEYDLKESLCNYCYQEEMHTCTNPEIDFMDCTKVDILYAEHFEEIRNNKLSRKRHGSQREER